MAGNVRDVEPPAAVVDIEIVDKVAAKKGGRFDEVTETEVAVRQIGFGLVDSNWAWYSRFSAISRTWIRARATECSSTSMS
mgnify:CR=1 FL=1